MASPVLRPASSLDIGFCWRLHEATLRCYVEATWGHWDEADQRRRFGAWFEPARLRIVEVDGARVGFLKVDADAARVTLLSIAVDPAHQRRGIGTWLVRRVVDEAGSRPVRLQVLKVNPARRLYERLGFVEVADTPTHWQLLRGPAVACRRDRDGTGSL